MPENAKSGISFGIGGPLIPTGDLLYRVLEVIPTSESEKSLGIMEKL